MQKDGTKAIKGENQFKKPSASDINMHLLNIKYSFFIIKFL